MGIRPADAFDVCFRQQVFTFEQGGAFRQKHGGADEAFFHGIVEFAVRFQNAFVGVDDITARREARHKTGVRHGDETFDAFAAQEALKYIYWKVMSICDGHDGHVVF